MENSVIMNEREIHKIGDNTKEKQTKRNRDKIGQRKMEIYDIKISMSTMPS